MRVSCEVAREPAIPVRSAVVQVALWPVGIHPAEPPFGGRVRARTSGQTSGSLVCRSPRGLEVGYDGDSHIREILFPGEPPVNTCHAQIPVPLYPLRREPQSKHLRLLSLSFPICKEACRPLTGLL